MMLNFLENPYTFCHTSDEWVSLLALVYQCCTVTLHLNCIVLGDRSMNERWTVGLSYDQNILVD